MIYIDRLNLLGSVFFVGSLSIVKHDFQFVNTASKYASFLISCQSTTLPGSFLKINNIHMRISLPFPSKIGLI